MAQAGGHRRGRRAWVASDEEYDGSACILREPRRRRDGLATGCRTTGANGCAGRAVARRRELFGRPGANMQRTRRSRHQWTTRCRPASPTPTRLPTPRSPPASPAATRRRWRRSTSGTAARSTASRSCGRARRRWPRTSPRTCSCTCSRHADDYDPRAGRCLPWLLGIARNFVHRRAGIDRFTRRRRRRRRTSCRRRPRSPRPRSIAQQDLEALRRPSPRCRRTTATCSCWSSSTERSYAEAAAICGCELNTVRSRLSRARALLARWLDVDARRAATPRSIEGCIMTAAYAELDRRLAALRDATASFEPPLPPTDAAIAAAVAAPRHASRRPAGRHALARVAARARRRASSVVSFVVRSLRPDAGATDAAAIAPSAQATSSCRSCPWPRSRTAGTRVVVPARVPRTTLAQFGVPIDPARADDAIDTELLVRRDGCGARVSLRQLTYRRDRMSARHRHRNVHRLHALPLALPLALMLALATAARAAADTAAPSGQTPTPAPKARSAPLRADIDRIVEHAQQQAREAAERAEEYARQVERQSSGRAICSLNSTTTSTCRRWHSSAASSAPRARSSRMRPTPRTRSPNRSRCCRTATASSSATRRSWRATPTAARGRRRKDRAARTRLHLRSDGRSQLRAQSAEALGRAHSARAGDPRPADDLARRSSGPGRRHAGAARARRSGSPGRACTTRTTAARRLRPSRRWPEPQPSAWWSAAARARRGPTTCGSKSSASAAAMELRWRPLPRCRRSPCRCCRAARASASRSARRDFDGIKAEGTQTTHTIPAGEIGNEKPIVITSERWFSPELHSWCSRARATRAPARRPTV